MKQFILIVLLFISRLTSLSAQSFPGYNTGNYTGVNGVFFNPANIADSRYRWDFNLFGISAFVGNNKASFKRNDLLHFNGDTIKDRFLSGGPVSGMASLVVLGPSLFFNTGKKSAIALTTASHILVNVADIDPGLAEQFIDNGNENLTFPYTLSSSQNMRVNVNAYTEFGLSYARVVFEQRQNFLKAGVTLKYLAGTANGYMQINGLHGTIGEDAEQEAYLTNAGGSAAIGLGGINLSGFTPKDLLSFKSTGFGGDIGLVYEFRPDVNETRRDLNKYLFKVGLSLLDIGSISYQSDHSRSGSYDIHIPNGQRFYLHTLSGAGIDNVKDTFSSYPQYFTAEGDTAAAGYKVSLPTTMQLEIDYHLHRGFYINVAAQAALTTLQNNKLFNGGYYHSVTITPRYEGRGIGFFVPVNYSSLTAFSAGIALRFGPLYFGSGSILTAAFGSSKRVDAFIGLHIGSLQKKHTRYRKKTKFKQAIDNNQQLFNHS